jgi:hypothetical protein
MRNSRALIPALEGDPLLIGPEWQQIPGCDQSPFGTNEKRIRGRKEENKKR